jgi:SDR family mycofactocin-dependent oxidoreductase
MPRLLEDRVAFITGAARGQGRSHAVRLAAEGANIVALDLCGEAVPVGYPVATPEDLEETVRLVEKSGRQIVARQGDVRSQGDLDAAVAAGVQQFGRLDVVVANAGVVTWDRFWEMPEDNWQALLDINLNGVWRTFKSAAPVLIEQGWGGSMIAIGSVAGLKSLPAQAHYSAAKHGIVGLVKAAAIELGPFKIRVNSIHPWGVDTPMAHDPSVTALLGEHPTYVASYGSILPQPTIADPADISEAVVWLAADTSRAVTGIQLPVDMGATTV